MLALLTFFIKSIVFILALSAVFGIVAFFKDLHDFKSEKQLSLPRHKLIESLVLEEQLKNIQDTTQKDGDSIV